MGIAIDTVSGSVTNPGATLTAWTVNSGDALTVRNFSAPAQAFIIDANFRGATAPTGRIRSPRLHDALQAIQLKQVAADGRSVWPRGTIQQVFPQDALQVHENGGAAEVDIGSLLFFYQDLPGVDARLVSWQQIANRIQHLVTVEASFTSAATAGLYSATVAMNGGANDILIANRDYALLGYNTDTDIGRVCIRGADSGNLRLSGPGTTDKTMSSNWFRLLSDWTGLPCIPVFNAANKASILGDITHTATGTSVVVDYIFALLAQ